MERRGQFEPFEFELKNIGILEPDSIGFIERNALRPASPSSEEYTGIIEPQEQRYVYARAIQEATGTPGATEDIDRVSTLFHGALIDGTEFKLFSGQDLERFILNILGRRRFVVLTADFPSGTATIESHPPQSDFSDIPVNEI